MSRADANPVRLMASSIAARPSTEHQLFEELQFKRRAMKYKVALTRSDEGYSVSCPGLPGCWSQGQTEEEALANIRDAIREYLEVRDELFKNTETREVEVVV